MRSLTAMRKLLPWSPIKTTRHEPIRLVVIQASPFCNLDCTYCYLPDRSHKQRLSLDLLDPLFRKLFTTAFVDKGFTVLWHAGEPLAVPLAFYEAAFAKIAELDRELNTKNLRITHSIQTNATL